MSERAERLAEMVRLSRKPHAELHSKLLDAVLGAPDKLSDDEWLTLARRAPDRLLQGLSMSGRLAGYSDRQEVQHSSGDLVAFALRVQAASDAELEVLRAELDQQLAELERGAAPESAS